MNRRRLVIAVALGLLVVGGLLVFALVYGTGDDMDGGPAPLPDAEAPTDTPVDVESPTAEPPSTAEPEVDPAVTVDEPVPDDVVAALFDKLQAQDIVPLMNETYTVEFDETTDRVLIEGEFEDGPATVVFVWDGTAWTAEGGVDRP